MKTVAPHPFGGIAARDRQRRGHRRHVLMEGRVEAGYLWDLWKAALHFLDEADLTRQMLGIERRNAPQLCQQRRRYALGAGMQHAMHHSMTNGIGTRA